MVFVLSPSRRFSSKWLVSVQRYSSCRQIHYLFFFLRIDIYPLSSQLRMRAL